MKHIKLFEEYGFEKVKTELFISPKMKKRANYFYNLIKDDDELIQLVKDFKNELPTYSEGPEPRPASDKLRKKVKELLPEDEDELFKIHFIKSDWLTNTGTTDDVSIYYLVINKLLRKIKQ